MKVRNLAILVVGILSAFRTAPALATGRVEIPAIYTDPLRWDDLVVRGHVTKLEYATLAAEQWYSSGLLKMQKYSQSVDVMYITLAVEQVLRGDAGGPEAVLSQRRFAYARDELAFAERVTIGSEVILTASYVRWPKVRWGLGAVFVETGDGWSRFAVGPPRWVDPITYEEIQDRVSSVAVPQMTRDSDLVIRGRIMSHTHITEYTRGVDEYAVTVESVVKGEASGTILVRSMSGFSRDETKWRTMLPQGIAEGASCYLFLKKNGDVYEPAAGRRSAFRVSDGQLYENAYVPSAYDVRRLERDVREFATE